LVYQIYKRIWKKLLVYTYEKRGKSGKLWGVSLLLKTYMKLQNEETTKPSRAQFEMELTLMREIRMDQQRFTRLVVSLKILVIHRK
jgi:hypothetical protein